MNDRSAFETFLQRCIIDKVLDLRHQNLKDSDVFSVTQFLTLHPEITEVDFGFNQLTRLGARDFGLYNRSVKKVSFRANQIGDKGLSDFVLFNHIVTEADFSHTDISTLKEFFRLNSDITHVDFSMNIKLKDEGVVDIFKDHFLEKLNISNFNMSEGMRKKIFAFMSKRQPEEKKFFDYQQTQLKKKINLYLQQKNRPLLRDHGYCSGLTLLWLYKMAEGKETWFYNLVKQIVQCPDNQLQSLEIQLEKFIAHIEWAQHPYDYTTLNQRSLQDIMEIHSVFSNGCTKEYDLKKLERLFDLYMHDECMMRVAGKNHAIGVFRRGGDYFVYDANYESGEAEKFSSYQFKKIFEEIKEILKFGKDDNPALRIDVGRLTRRYETRFFKRKLDEVKDGSICNAKKMKI